MFACTSLVNSELSKKVKFLTLDTTASTNNKRSLLERGAGAAVRMIRFFFMLLTNRVDTVMVFCSGGFSFKEKGTMIKIAKALGKKTIIAPRSGHLIDDIEKSESFKKFVASVFRKSDHVICQGSFWQKYFTVHFDLSSEKTVVIHNWIDQKDVKISGHDNVQMTILFLGWIERNKGIYEILDAADQLREKNIKWIIGGNGKEYEQVVDLVKKKELQDQVDMRDWVLHEEKDVLLASCDIFIIPSYREGLPNALLEAMMNGLAVIASNVGGIPDIIESYKNGILVEPGNTDEIIEAVKFYHEHPDEIKAYGAQAMDTIKKKNTLNTAILKFETIL